MTTRRSFLTTALAATTTLAAPALAQDAVAPAEPQAPDITPRVVRISGAFLPGEIHVDPGAFALYLILPEGRAIRYAVGIGRAGLYERGDFFIGAKKEWPSWTPTKEMIERNPDAYAKYADGMPGGPNNPLGARALYLFTQERGDTFLRIHGTNKPGTIGTAVSNGCVRLVNEHIADLYNRVPIGARAVLH
ncbi:MAG: hypothetical protein CSA72_11385 [Rhodobacterales bacterium]|nr:MAG: hypothetical protein CSA72_11385 [Rhodobacterales bacterium]